MEGQCVEPQLVPMVIMGIPPGIGIDDKPLKGVYLLQLKLDDILKRHRSFSTPTFHSSPWREE
jgi:hypothetical protein